MKHYHTLINANNVPSILILNEDDILKRKILGKPYNPPKTAHKSKRVDSIVQPADRTYFKYQEARCWLMDWLIKNAEEGDCITGHIVATNWKGRSAYHLIENNIYQSGYVGKRLVDTLLDEYRFKEYGTWKYV